MTVPGTTRVAVSITSGVPRSDFGVACVIAAAGWTAAAGGGGAGEAAEPACGAGAGAGGVEAPVKAPGVAAGGCLAMIRSASATKSCQILAGISPPATSLIGL